jgi:hypothetical protein
LVGDGVTQDFTLDTPVADPTELITFATLRAAEFIPTVDYTVSGTTLHFNTAPTNFERIDIIRRSKYYKSIGYISGAINSNFGCSVVTNRDGSVISIGSNLETTNSIDNNGRVTVYHRTITEFVTDGVSGTYTAPDSFNSIFRVLFNGVALVDGTDYYTVGTSSVQFPSFATPAVGQKLRVETNQFILDQIIDPSETGLTGQKFGSVLALCGTGCNLYSSSPYYTELTYSAGLVSRYVNVGRVYGTVIVPPGSVACIKVTVLAIHAIGKLSHSSLWTQVVRSIGNQFFPIYHQRPFFPL